MIDQLLSALKRYVLETKGDDAWIEMLEIEIANARIQRANAHAKLRSAPDYDGLLPDNVRNIAEASRMP